MAGASGPQGSQNRCVFVGNIPYDATEEQLIQICEEVGPVVSFRLVIDRETAKPKGYGFCEYKDEETALSARRNLQGYEINGRQLRVDFAENDKGTDRIRDQGRGGPGLTSKTDAQKSTRGPPILGDPALHQPLGIALASTAASVMARALGGAQTAGSSSIQNSLQGQSGLGNDPLTHFLSKMSKHQLNEVVSEMKALATQNKPLAQQLMHGHSELPKALFQAQIMLGLVSPQMLQMGNNRQSSSSVYHTSQDRLENQRSSVPHFPGQISLPAEAQGGLLPRVSVSTMGNLDQNRLAFPLQSSAAQARFQHPIPTMGQNLIQGTMLGGVPKVHSAQSQSLSNIPIKPQGSSLLSSEGFQPQMQFPSSHLPRPVGIEHGRHHAQPALSDASLQHPIISHPIISQTGLPAHPINADRHGASPNPGVGSVVQASMAVDTTEPIGRPPKIPRLGDGMVVPHTNMGGDMPSNGSYIAQSAGVGASSSAQVATGGKPAAVQLPTEVESILLQQVMNLTPEQLSSLPAEQQQQVIELQKAMGSALLVARQ